ncbi:MAG: hypothetical protein V1916_02975 [Patescibacteria group bacterium]
MPVNNGFNLVIVLVIIFAVAVIGGTVFYFAKNKANPTNTNAPVKVNANNNTNAIANVNVITNQNVNNTVNVNANTNFAANVNVNTTTNTQTSGAFTDSDSDGIPDKYEVFLFSDPQKPDTDKDGLLDGAELAHGFSPLAAGVAIYQTLYSQYCWRLAASELPMLSADEQTAYCSKIWFTSAMNMFNALYGDKNADVSTVDISPILAWCHQTYSGATGTACANSIAPNLGIFFQSKKIFDWTAQ